LRIRPATPTAGTYRHDEHGLGPRDALEVSLIFRFIHFWPPNARAPGGIAHSAAMHRRSVQRAGRRGLEFVVMIGFMCFGQAFFPASSNTQHSWLVIDPGKLSQKNFFE
jgi:hypothetical protein